MSSLEMMRSNLGMFQKDLPRLRENWGWFLAEGIFLALLGFLACGSAVSTTLVSVLFFGWLLLIGGVVHVIHSFFTGSWSGFFLELLTGILYGIAGLLMVSSPAITALTLTLMIAPLFMVGGIFRTVAAAASQLPQWGWACASGVVTFLVGLLIWKQLPASGLWVIGTLIGVELIVRGMAIMAFAFSLHSLPKVQEIRKAA